MSGKSDLSPPLLLLRMERAKPRTPVLLRAGQIPSLVRLGLTPGTTAIDPGTDVKLVHSAPARTRRVLTYDRRGRRTFTLKRETVANPAYTSTNSSTLPPSTITSLNHAGGTNGNGTISGGDTGAAGERKVVKEGTVAIFIAAAAL